MRHNQSQQDRITLSSSVCSVIVRKDWLMINMLYSDQSIQKNTQMKIHLSYKDPASHICSVHIMMLHQFSALTADVVI